MEHNSAVKSLFMLDFKNLKARGILPNKKIACIQLQSKLIHNMK
jgi:hypothetical protein